MHLTPRLAPLMCPQTSPHSPVTVTFVLRWDKDWVWALHKEGHEAG